MLLLQLDCEVFYKGRGESYLERGDRLIVIKNDNSVTIHQDSKMGPLNYMKEFSTITEKTKHNQRWMVISSKTETIKILIHQEKYRQELQLTEDSSLEKKGTESHLQQWLSAPHNFQKIFGDDTKFVMREFDTGNGSCDLLGYNKTDNNIMLIEVKRTAYKKDIYQVIRYADAVELLTRSIPENSKYIPTRQDVKITCNSANDPKLILIASEVKNGVKEEGSEHNVEVIELGYEWILDNK